MDAKSARYRAAMERRGKRAKALRARLSARAALASARARRPYGHGPRHPAQRGERVRPVGQRAGPAGGGDESDSEDSRILDPAGGDDPHPGSGDESSGDDAAQPGQPEGFIARLGARVFRVRLLLGGQLAPGGQHGEAGEHHGPAAVDPPPLLMACEHCHTIPYQKGVCCSNVGVRTECPKCHAMVWQGALSKRCRVHCLCAQGTLSMYSGALSMCAGGTVHERWEHCP
jgi:hypothetical protein